ncbi:MAG: cytidylate kinase family protein [Syntrophobacteraceae bacterium]|jgi:cytidylate kinase
MAVVTISREPGAWGEELAARVAGYLGFSLIDKKSLAQIWDEINPDEAALCVVNESGARESGVSVAQNGDCAGLSGDLIAQLAEEQDLVVIGRGAQGLFHDRPGTLHVRVVAPRRFRIRQAQILEGLSAREAGRRIRSIEELRARHLRSIYGISAADPNLYDLTLRMDRLSVEQALKLIVTAVDEMGLRQVPRGKIVSGLVPESFEKRGRGRFANATEIEFARFLEFYHIPYDYEPRTFPLEYDGNGKVTEAFTPDFYLREQDLYIELTTMKQSLVTRKNRKVRKLRRLYPDVRILIFYQRDFYSLMAKYGLLAGRKQPDPERISR